MDTIILRQSTDNQFYWVKVAGNNEVVSLSESYTRKHDAERAAEREAQAADLEVVDETDVAGPL